MKEMMKEILTGIESLGGSNSEEPWAKGYDEGVDACKRLLETVFKAYGLSENDDNKYDALLLESYRRYQLDWMASHGYWVADAVNAATNAGSPVEPGQCMDNLWENGFDGDIWAGLDEFEDSEFKDAQYMYCLLPEQTAKVYQAIRIRELLLKENPLDESPFVVPGELLMPNQLTWNWPAGVKRCEITAQMNKIIEEGAHA